MEFKIDSRERLYFALRVGFSFLVLFAAVWGLSALVEAGGVGAVSTLSVLVIYLVLIWLFFAFQKLYLVAYLRGNGVPITERQFSEVHAAYREMGEKLGLRKLPRLYLLQEGGFLNAFAVRQSGRNYVAVYSEILALLEEEPEALRFVLGHELGHVKRRHLSKRFWTFPSAIIPFLGAAYSRRCEYSCDNIGGALAPEGGLKGLLVLAAGPRLYRRVDPAVYVEEARSDTGPGVRFMGLFMSHPYLPRRIANLRKG